eukprot:6132878-Prymnesium_polylepis.1
MSRSGLVFVHGKTSTRHRPSAQPGDHPDLRCETDALRAPPRTSVRGPLLSLVPKNRSFLRCCARPCQRCDMRAPAERDEERPAGSAHIGGRKFLHILAVAGRGNLVWPLCRGPRTRPSAALWWDRQGGDDSSKFHGKLVRFVREAPFNFHECDDGWVASLHDVPNFVWTTTREERAKLMRSTFGRPAWRVHLNHLPELYFGKVDILSKSRLPAYLRDNGVAHCHPCAPPRM